MTRRRTFRALLVFATALPAAAGASPIAVALDEVVVTARKVEEDVREVPMSVTVLGAEALADARQSHLYGLQFDVPGLVVNNIGMFGAGLSLRGVSDQVGAGAVVATHMNGVYLGSPQLAISRLYDLERIEVLKGPQGTLYGRNSTGGSINILTRRPEEAGGAGVEAAYGSFSTGRVQGHADLPAAGAAFGLAFIASNGDGYIRNSIDDRRFAEADYWAMRVSAGMRFGNAGRLDLMAQHAQDDGATGELWTPNPEFLANPRDIRLATVTLEDPYLELDDDIVTANLAYDFGRAELVSVTGFARNGVRNRDDCAGIPDFAGCIRGDRDGRYSQWSQELQLRISGPSSVDGLVGAYYFRSDGDNQFYLYFPEPGPGYLNDARQTGEDLSMALFGQATIALGERWSTDRRIAPRARRNARHDGRHGSLGQPDEARRTAGCDRRRLAPGRAVRRERRHAPLRERGDRLHGRWARVRHAQRRARRVRPGRTRRLRNGYQVELAGRAPAR